MHSSTSLAVRWSELELFGQLWLSYISQPSGGDRRDETDLVKPVQHLVLEAQIPDDVGKRAVEAAEEKPQQPVVLVLHTFA